MVERSLSMREVLGSMPSTSNLFIFPSNSIIKVIYTYIPQDTDDKNNAPSS